MPITRMRVPLRDGLSLNARVVEVGFSQQTIVLLHGFTGSSAAWGDETLEQLADHLRVVAVDLIGHGQSSRPHDPARYAMDEVVADVVALLDAVDEPAPVLMGYSMGGRVAVATAVAHGQRLGALVLESASPGLRHQYERDARMAEDEALALRIEQDGLEAFVDAWMARPLFAGQAKRGAAWLEAERERRLSQDPVALAACLRGLGTGSQPSYWDALEALRVPTKLMVGSDDEKFETIASHMASRLPLVALVTHNPSIGHAIHAEAPEMWARGIASFALNPWTLISKPK